MNEYVSNLAPLIIDFLEFKNALGIQYLTGSYYLKQLNIYLSFRTFIHKPLFCWICYKQLLENAQNIRNFSLCYGKIKVTNLNLTKQKERSSLCLILPQILIL